jgi:ETFB lysine methyltransferase
MTMNASLVKPSEAIKGTFRQGVPAPNWSDGRMSVTVGGREWFLEREEDMEGLWDEIDVDEFGEDERMPYWAELWPASLLLGEWLILNRELIAGRECLELGCGMGLTAIIGSVQGARLTAMDLEFRALRRARANAAINEGANPLWTAVDWRFPAFQRKGFDYIWASDILYETRFHAPLAPLFKHYLKPGGKVWLGEPWRRVSEPVWGKLITAGFTVRKIVSESVPFEHYKSTVNIWEVTLNP